ncbi:wound-induced protein 1 [Tripterygium wilfordii]|uniref:Wound-induced protein 1 n=1 Tax=Tripterygium wilfordii TaxID=458696 RepID=A0A7J7DWK7_TRIWF|nr:wound-induced protein 1-like [Tripterygium wilfordii]KAF5750760.1 wound-induced protein 1 [Tripterygium wilfordii]
MATNETNSPVAESDSNPTLETQIATLYRALAKSDRQAVAKLVATDLEYWFHGPPNCQHMMQVLTGESGRTDFNFEPRSIDVVGEYAIAEGWEGKNVYWVHVWTLKDGVITQFREYFNTWLTVRHTRPRSWHERRTLWQSQPRDLARRSLPGVVLAI